MSRWRARPSRLSICPRTRAKAWCRLTAAWSSVCTPTWRAARWRSRKRLGRAELRPGARGFGLVLVARDLARLLLCQTDIVEAVEHAVFAKRVDLELDHAAVRPVDFLLLQIDRERGVGAALGVVEQLLQIVGADSDRQHAVLETVVVEDVTERGRYHAADAKIHQRPGCVLARGAATEIVTGDKDFRLAISRLVEHEIGVLAAVILVAHLGEQAFAEPSALDGLQILLRDDHVGVDIDHL